LGALSCHGTGGSSAGCRVLRRRAEMGAASARTRPARSARWRRPGRCPIRGT